MTYHTSIVHYDNNRDHGDVCCGATDIRGRGPTRGRRTTDPALVTCKRCLKSMQAQAQGSAKPTGLAAATETRAETVRTPHRIGRSTLYVERVRREFRDADGRLVGGSVSQAFRLLDARGEELGTGTGDAELKVILGFYAGAGM